MKQLTFLFVLFFATLPFLQSCQRAGTGKIVEGNRLIIDHLVDITDFTCIRMDCGGEIIYQQLSEEAPYFQITTDENILPYLELKVENNCLVISKNDTTIAPSRLVVYTNSRNLNQIVLSDSASIRLEGEVNSLQMNVSVTEKAQITADSLFCREIRVDADGYGNIKLTGAATYGVFRTGENAVLDLHDFPVEYYN
jgi:hypothetical protein